MRSADLRQQLADLRANRDHLDANQQLLLNLIDSIQADHERRVSELLAALRRLAADDELFSIDEKHPSLEKEHRARKAFARNVIAAAEAQPEPGSGDA